MSDTVVSVLSQFQLISISQIQSSPYQARKDFDEGGIRSLADSIEKEGLQQPITLRKVGDGYELISGERRLRAMKLLGQTSIEAKVIEVPSEASAAAKGLVENLQRQDLNPIEEAEGFAALNKLDPLHWTHEQIAKVTGKDRTYVTKSLAVLSLPVDIIGNVRQRTLTREHGIELLRLNSAKEQSRLAHKVGKKGLTVKQTREIVDRKLGKGENRRGRQLSAPAGQNADPHADLWPSLHAQQGFAPDVDWEVKYGTHKPSPGISLLGWFFFAGAAQGISKAALVGWFRQMLQALETGQAEPVQSEAERQALALSEQMRQAAELVQKADPAEMEKNKVLNERAAELWMPKTAEEAQEMDEGSRNIRMPQTPQDWVEVETIAKEGPRGLYEWMYGKGSYWAKKAAPMTWQDLGEPDPVGACHKIVDGMRQSQNL